MPAALPRPAFRTTSTRVNGTLHDFMMLNPVRDTVPGHKAFSLLTGLIV
jgi:hypothetical protein